MINLKSENTSYVCVFLVLENIQDLFVWIFVLLAAASQTTFTFSYIRFRVRFSLGGEFSVCLL